jgi:hypothetical protein
MRHTSSKTLKHGESLIADRIGKWRQLNLSKLVLWWVCGTALAYHSSRAATAVGEHGEFLSDENSRKLDVTPLMCIDGREEGREKEC